MIVVTLPYPAKALWPNGRAHHMTKAGAVKKHRKWADAATLEVLPVRHPLVFAGEAPIPIHIIVEALPSGPMPDTDNVVASAKAYLDGIAGRLGVNDRRFMAPTVEFTGRSPAGAFRIVIGDRA